MNAVFIYNPVSGRGGIASKLALIERELKKKYSSVEMYASKGQGDVTEKVASTSCEAVIFSGGDGTFNEVLQGLKRQNRKIELGYIPCGTVNDIARSLKIPRNVRGALRIITSGKAKSFDVMEAEGRLALYELSAGAFTSCSYRAKHNVKKIFGRIAYVLEILRNNLKFDKFTVAIQSKNGIINVEAVMLLFMNGRSIASLRVNPYGKMDDGEVEALVVTENTYFKTKFFRRTVSFFKILKAFVFGYRKKTYDKRILLMKGSEFSVDVPSGIVWNYDGEEGGSGATHIKVLNGFVSIIVR